MHSIGVKCQTISKDIDLMSKKKKNPKSPDLAAREKGVTIVSLWCKNSKHNSELKNTQNPDG